MAAGENFRVSVIGEMPATHAAVIFDFGLQDQSGGSVHIDCAQAAGDFQTAVQAAILAVARNDYTIRRYRFACVHSSAGHLGEVGYVDDVNQDGTISMTSADLPNEICISMKRNTGHVGRRDRGRVFFGPVSHTFRVGLNGVDISNSSLQDFRDLGRTPLLTQTVLLKPVILASDGTSTNREIVNVSIGLEFVHRKSRRTRLFN